MYEKCRVALTMFLAALSLAAVLSLSTGAQVMPMTDPVASLLLTQNQWYTTAVSTVLVGKHVEAKAYVDPRTASVYIQYKEIATYKRYSQRFRCKQYGYPGAPVHCTPLGPIRIRTYTRVIRTWSKKVAGSS
ncbi:hypothetical protein KJ567_02765 [Candidatus Bipolaricaulota bacterium]|nr:hypothetical protein [Candidatus Bipolaricaulota bacterium]